MARARIGIIGLGVIGKAHLSVLQETENAELVAISDPTQAARDFAAARNVKAYDDYRKMLDGERLDGVVIGSPNAEHVPMALECIARGIAALVEKPISDTVESARRLCDAAESKDVPILVGHHRRHNPAVQAVRKAVAEGVIGKPAIATVMYTQLKPESYFQLGWRRDKASGGPILINLIHEIDLVRFIFGEIDSLQAASASAVRGFEVEDTAAVLLRFRSGALGTISLSDTAATPFTWDLASGEFDQMSNTTDRLKRQKVSSHVFAGSEGSLTLPDVRHFSYRGDGEPGWLSELSEDQLAITPASAYRLQAAHFARVALRQEAPLISGRDGMRTLEATLAVKQAAASGCAVKLAD
ncbi:Gfo/Idh/MocA family protein [Bosea sp. (in: a-proteobacteria)]|uniref:Gfo/Idh/MocA family protein n=1 Tax=Bosea sp. (in: a-proteobacteria) TaxID=1871050 RepID=UPI002FC5EE78